MKITEHFDSTEFDQPARHGFIHIEYPRIWIEPRLRPLCELMEVIRQRWGLPIDVLSGYRSREYNDCPAVGGKPNSQHIDGEAADMRIDGIAIQVLHDTTLELYQTGRLPRLGGLGIYLPSPKRVGWIHVDIRAKPIVDGKPHLARWTG